MTGDYNFNYLPNANACWPSAPWPYYFPANPPPCNCCGQIYCACTCRYKWTITSTTGPAPVTTTFVSGLPPLNESKELNDWLL